MLMMSSVFFSLNLCFTAGVSAEGFCWTASHTGRVLRAERLAEQLDLREDCKITSPRAAGIKGVEQLFAF